MKKLLRAAGLLFCAGSALGASRPPAVAGRFYPGTPQALEHEIRRLFAAASAGAQTPAALLVPHAGLEFSGEAAARAYKQVPPGGFDSVILVGAGHRKAVEGAAIYPGDYTALQYRMTYDPALAAELRRASPLIVDDARAHDDEHSLEVQIPFLGQRFGAVKGVALVVNTQDLEVTRALGQALARAARGRRVLLVASSDLSHYPEGAVADKVDRSTLEALAGIDPGFFWLTNRLLLNRGLPDLSVTYCGEGAVTAVLAAARELGAGSMRLLARLNSGDVVSEREYNHVVGYASAAFFPAEPPARLLRLSAVDKRDLLRLARQAVEERLAKGRARAPGLSHRPRFNLPAASFVTVRIGGELRGCMGTTSAEESLVESVSRQAAAAATEDARFKPLTAAELAEAKLEISILTPPKSVRAADIKPGDGVILEAPGGRGALLPQAWGSLPEKERFLAELCSKKAGLPADCHKGKDVEFKTFSVDEFREP